MDSRTLHGLGNVRGERKSIRVGEQEGGRTSTRSSRRSPTRSSADSADAPHAPDNDGLNTTIASNIIDSEWAEQSVMEGSGGRSPPRDLRKSVEATTPTLMDEPDCVEDEDEEQEMISYERERLRRTTQRFFPGNETNLRRTPGAQMYRSQFDQERMRRTPGAVQMHKSSTAGTAISQETGGGDVSGLGFGLTLSTPVAPSTAKPLNLASAWEPSLPPQARISGQEQGVKPPLPRGSSSREYKGAFMSPHDLAKGSHSRHELGHGAYSPNTLRLSEDLGNLLLEDEGDVAGKPEHFGIGAEKVTAFFDGQVIDSEQECLENWTAPYVISMDAPSRVPRSSTRGRRGKPDGARRSRGFERISSGPRSLDDQSTSRTGGFLQHAQQPKPVRGVNPEVHAGVHPQFNFGFQPPVTMESNGAGAGAFHQTTDSGSVPRQLNFGGAFAPPTKSQPHMQPSASNTMPQGAPGAFYQAPSFGNQPAFAGNAAPYGATSFPPPFPNSFQQAGPPEFGASQDSKFQPQFGTQPFMFGAGHPPLNQSPSFNFTPQNMPYAMHGAPIQPPSPHGFMPVMHQRSQLPQFGGAPPQQWAPVPIEMQYDGMSPPLDHSANWHSGPAWPMGEYGYATMSRSAESPALSMTPTPQTWTPEPELVQVDPNSYTTQGVPYLAPSPAPGKGPKKAQRKSTKKNAKPPMRAEKAAKPETPVPGSKSPVSRKTKKKPSKSNNQGSTPTPTEELGGALPEDMGESRRAEIDETADVKASLKDFTKKLRTEERSSFDAAQSFALSALAEKTLPESVHWKVFLELADLAKRANRFGEARKLYQKVCTLQPTAVQGWLEFSKLEEECGNMGICAKILRAGIEYCEYNDSLYARAIKHAEKMGNVSRARELLSRLKHLGIENVWRTVLEGALLEARAGNHVMSRRVLKYVMHHVPWYGPLYLEAYKLEKNLGRSREALEVVERGLSAIPRYGPLWFGAFKLCEELDQSANQLLLPQAMAMVDRATHCVSKEIIWKVHLEAAQMLERAASEIFGSTNDPNALAVMDLCRKRFAMTILTCPPNLRWKVWLAAGRMEVSAGNPSHARQLFLRAHKVVPDKGRAVALLECARLEEYVGDIDLADAILCKSRYLSGSDWKVWLESVLFETRRGNRRRAIELAELALRSHSGTGRLWASLVQLYQPRHGETKQFNTLRLALNAVPKSGEVWCEGARIHLNPFARSFDPPRARRQLSFATKFTPQYGDGFLEMLRLEMIDQWLVPIAKLVWEITRKQLDLTPEITSKDALVKYVGSIAKALFLICPEGSGEVEADLPIDRGMVKMIRSRLDTRFLDSLLDLSELQQRCANADPNYGLLWFHCRQTPSGTARQIIARATELMKGDLRSFAHIYITALVRRLAILTQYDNHVRRKPNPDPGDSSSPRPPAVSDLEESILTAYLSAPSLNEIIQRTIIKDDEASTGMVLLESTMTGSSFVSGLIALCNQTSTYDGASLPDRRKLLFGADALFS